jgi:hypothetical protein
MREMAIYRQLWGATGQGPALACGTSESVTNAPINKPHALSVEEFIRTLRRCAMRGAPVLLIFFAPSVLVAQNVKVLVLDALSGKPQSGVEVHYFCQSGAHNFLPEDSDITNSEGLAIVSYPCKEDQKIEFSVTALPKEECGGLDTVTFKEISSVGIISAPDGEGQMQCPTKISRKLKPISGQVIIFVKKPSWWQSHF